MLAPLGFGAPQDVDRPLTCDQVKQFWTNENSAAFAKGTTRARLEKAGIEFELDSACVSELRKAPYSIPGDLMRGIRVMVSSITIQCQPVECEVTLNNEIVGQTIANVMTKSPIKPGPVSIKVNGAPGYGIQTADVTVSPGEHLKVSPFTLPLRTGELAITCKPAPVCGIRVKGKNNGYEKSGDTAQQKFNAAGLALGEYEVEARSLPDYFSKTQIVWVSTPTLHTLDVELVEDPWGSKTPLQVWDAIVGALGGKEILNDAKLSRNTARVQMKGDPVSIGNYPAIQVVETLAPNRLRWDMTIAASKWSVIFDGTKAASNGDRKFRGSEFAQELEHSIRLFSDMRLPFVLSLIREKFDIKKGPNLIMVAESKDTADERYTFYLNADFSPAKVLHEHLTAPRSQEEVEFAQYKPINQDFKLPHVVILRYLDRPKHEQVFQYDKIDITAPVKEEQFKR
jgi:hypothetical protein